MALIQTKLVYFREIALPASSLNSETPTRVNIEKVTVAMPLTANEEIRHVPSGWSIRKKIATGQVHYTHPQHAPQGTYRHPVFGDLPKGWQMHKIPAGYFYLNVDTGAYTRERPDPPSSKPNAGPHAPTSTPPHVSPPAPASMLSRTTAPPPPPAPSVGSLNFRVPPGFAKVVAGMNLARNEISTVPLDDKYETVRVIDPGDGSKGGMNAGVFVVRSKATKELFIQKCFKETDDFLIDLVKKEIIILRNLKCNSLVQYVDGFMQDHPFHATVYMEFCDCGDLGDLIGAYKARKKTLQNDPEHFVPESFIWHAFLAVLDGLHFLATGSSHLALNLSPVADPARWVPIVHRDIKPDNIMLKSRSTPGSTKPLYIILTDFGMACAEPDSRTDGPPWPLYGTPEYHAPELCFAPFPANAAQMHQVAGPHTALSDIWALAAVVHALCERDGLAHLDRACWARSSGGPGGGAEWRGRIARKKVLQIGPLERAVYSDRLEWCVKWAGEADPAKRPDARELVPRVKDHMDRWRADPNWAVQSAVDCRLPDWAVQKSDLV